MRPGTSTRSSGQGSTPRPTPWTTRPARGARRRSRPGRTRRRARPNPPARAARPTAIRPRRCGRATPPSRRAARPRAARPLAVDERALGRQPGRRPPSSGAATASNAGVVDAEDANAAAHDAAQIVPGRTPGRSASTIAVEPVARHDRSRARRPRPSPDRAVPTARRTSARRRRSRPSGTTRARAARSPSASCRRRRRAARRARRRSRRARRAASPGFHVTP